MPTASQKKSKLHIYLIMALTFVITSMMNVYPLTSGLALFRPMAMIMVLIFWLIFKPTLIGVGIAFFIGLISDFLLGTQLGQQALCAVVVAFFIKFISSYFKELPLLSVCLLASFCLTLYQSCLVFLHLIIKGVFEPQLFLTLISSIMLWPLLLIILGRYTE